jgi:hypothetical protein
MIVHSLDVEGAMDRAEVIEERLSDHRARWERPRVDLTGGRGPISTFRGYIEKEVVRNCEMDALERIT